ncbi:MAG: hypothetical protein BM564_07335 [Bacteroidetes bacterium MedPE-SWsnd-G2]|nr:MAG: hypothetical protein BM564_07335 [Bacteroidetes bacterium MedPE-SWsnd-G2]
MAKIKPFKAVRPTRDKVSLVAARAYQTYTQSERNARLDNNPYSFLHIVNPGYKFAKEISGKERYQLVKNRYLEFKEENVFKQDSKPHYYIYKIVDREDRVFNGIIAAASIEDYKANIIKKHEDTIEERELVFKDYLDTVGFNAEPVLLTYPDNKTIAQVIKTVQAERAEFEFTTTFRDTHYLWLIETPEQINILEDEFAKMDTIYIADGHHRSASSYLLSEEKNASNNIDSYNFFMSYLIPESELKIYEFNRTIKDLNGLSKEEFLIKLDTYFRIENRGNHLYKPHKKNHFCMYLDGDFYSLHLRKSVYKSDNALDALDPQILYNTILNPILGIKDLRNNSRIRYSHGKNDIVNIKSMIDNGEFAVGFNFFAVSIEEFKTIADQGLTMPPKSTFILPKLRSGVTIYEF